MKFTIRDILWLTFVVAIFLGWHLDNARQREQTYGLCRRYEEIYNKYLLLKNNHDWFWREGQYADPKYDRN